MQLQFFSHKGKRTGWAILLLFILSISTGCMKYSVDISKDRRVSHVVGQCYVAVGILKIYNPSDEPSVAYIESGGISKGQKLISWVPEGAKFTVTRVDEYHHPVNGVFYDPIIKVVIENKQYFAKGWALFSLNTSKDLQPDVRKIKPCIATTP